MTAWRPSSLCRDCSTDVQPRNAPHQWYAVHDSVWIEEAGMNPFGGVLCIDCLEARLGRPLTGADFPADVEINWPGACDDTQRLARLKYDATAAGRSQHPNQHKEIDQ